MKGTRTLSLVLAVAVLLGSITTVSARTGTAKSFSDVPDNAWYQDELNSLTSLEIIKGYEDGTFHPEEKLTRGEFITMLFNATETAVMMYDDNSIHWAQPYWNALNDMGIIAGSGIKCSKESLSGTITRNEMAVLITNTLYKAGFEDKVTLDNAGLIIKDYSAIPTNYQYYVEQAYGKGILTGYSDGTFGGSNGLKRCEAVAVVYRMLFANDRIMPTGSTTVKPDYTPVAVQWQNKGWIDAYGNASLDLRKILFGDANKTYFSSRQEAGDRLVAVTVPVWKLNNAGGKYSSTETVVVNAAVAEDVLAIFQQIFDDPEQFPIQGISSYRNTDTMRHSWGCAIDINPGYNAECRAYYSSGTVQFTSGSGWWPVGTEKTMFAGSLTEPSPYSIGANSSVVKAFADYGWGWGGQGYSVRNDNTQKFDYMHFSIMPSGG